MPPGNEGHTQSRSRSTDDVPQRAVVSSLNYRSTLKVCQWLISDAVARELEVRFAPNSGPQCSDVGFWPNDMQQIYMQGAGAIPAEDEWLGDGRKKDVERETHDLSPAEILASARLTIAEFGKRAEEIVLRRIAAADADHEHNIAAAWVRILEKIIAIRFEPD